jgi:hypothetical protein
MVMRSDLRHALDPAAWARSALAWEPDRIQTRLLRSMARRKIVNCTRQWGKSTTTAVKLMHMMTYRPGSLSLIVSPSGRQSGELLRKCESFAEVLGYAPKGDGVNEFSMLLPSGSRLVALPGSEAKTRGFGAACLLVVDEASRVPDALYKSSRAFVAIGGGEIQLLSTPFGRRGFFFEEWERSQNGSWERYEVPATECPRIDPAFLEEERQHGGEWWVKQEYLCQFVDVTEQVFSHQVLMDALRPEVKSLW